MNTDEDLGQWLRRELVEHESRQPPAPRLAEEVLHGARRTQRRRTWLVGIGAVAAATAIVAVASATVGPDRRGSESPPAGSSTGTGQEHADPTDSPPVWSVGQWASTLPVGDPPEVAYASGATLHLPTGEVVDLGGTGSAVIGDTAAGTVLLVERDDRDQGGEFRSWYDVVSADGDVTHLDRGLITGDRVQEAVVSPDGRWFANGRIFDMSTGQVTGALPAEADILLAWTPAGIVYGAGDAAYLWSPGARDALKLDNWPGVYPNGTDLGLSRRGGCPTIVHMTRDGSQDEVSRHCGVKAMTVSPEGSWLLTTGLVAIDTATGDEQQLAGHPMYDLGHAWDAHWLGEDAVLLSVPANENESAILIRCRVDIGTCERATGVVAGVGPNRVIGLP